MYLLNDSSFCRCIEASLVLEYSFHISVYMQSVDFGTIGDAAGKILEDGKYVNRSRVAPQSCTTSTEEARFGRQNNDIPVGCREESSEPQLSAVESV